MEQSLPRLQFARKQVDAPDAAEQSPWRVLIVDDEAEVHTVTELSLRNLRFDGRPIEFLHAYSGAEARRIVAATPDIHLVLLDVVMETDDAGLRFVDYLRGEIEDRRIRIVLRTGQPGLAPENEIIHRYDVNDYRLKTDLTHQKLMTSVVAALRGYNELSASSFEAAHAARARLRKTLDAAGAVSRAGAGHAFFPTLLRHVAEIIGANGNGLVCAPATAGGAEPVTILGAAGQFSRDATGQPAVLQRLAAVLASKESAFDDGSVALYIRSPISRELVVYCETEHPTEEADRLLLRLFAVNAGVCFDNLEMIEEMLAASIAAEDRSGPHAGSLLELAENFRAVLDDCPVAMVIGPPTAGTMAFVNARYATLMGVTAEVAASRPLEACFRDGEAAARYRAALGDRGSSRFDALLVRPSGEAFAAALTVARMPEAPGTPRVTWLSPVPTSAG